MACLCLATLTGAPALLIFSLFGFLMASASRGSGPSETTLVLFPWLLLAGSLSPVLTILATPSRLTESSARRRLIVILLCCGVSGWVLMLLGASRGFEDLGTLIGSSLSASSCAIGLGSVSGLIGSAIPQWQRMGSARQPVPPLVSAILLIGMLRIVIPQIPDGAITVIWTLRGTLIGAEVLLAIGTVYLLINRLWLANSLNKARIVARLRSGGS